MEPVEEYNASNLFQQVSSITDCYGYGSSTGAAEAYEALMKEIMKMTVTTTKMDEKILLKMLYPVEYALLNNGLEASDILHRNLLLELLRMDGSQMVRPLPAIRNTPPEAVLRFIDFEYINVTDQILEISMSTLKKKDKKQITFGPNSENKLLFVESNKDYAGMAIPFVWERVTSEGDYIFESPKIWDMNTTRWTIKIINSSK